MPIIGTPISGISGTYWTWDGIKNQLGKDNAEIRSQLDNEVTTADMDRVAEDGTVADVVINRRARLGGFVVPISEASDDFLLVRLTANLYASFLIAKHRQWFDQTGPEQEKLVGLEAEANEWLDRLFGPDPGGLDAEEDDDAETPSQAGTFQTVPMIFEPVASTDEDSA